MAGPAVLGGPLPGHPLVGLRLRLGEGIAREVILGVDGVLHGARSYHSGVPLADAILGGVAGSPMGSRMAAMSTASVMKAMIRISAPHRGQVNGNTSSMRAGSMAHRWRAGERPMAGGGSSAAASTAGFCRDSVVTGAGGSSNDRRAQGRVGGEPPRSSGPPKQNGNTPVAQVPQRRFGGVQPSRLHRPTTMAVTRKTMARKASIGKRPCLPISSRQIRGASTKCTAMCGNGRVRFMLAAMPEQR